MRRAKRPEDPVRNRSFGPRGRTETAASVSGSNRKPEMEFELRFQHHNPAANERFSVGRPVVAKSALNREVLVQFQNFFSKIICLASSLFARGMAKT